MDYMTKLRRLEPTRILSDRQLLAEFGMTDAAAAKLLGKSRQALNLKLGSKRSNRITEPYFKLSDLLVLVIAAQDQRHPFDHEAVWQFIAETAQLRAGGSEETLKLLKQRLKGMQEVDLNDVGTVVMILPAFADIRGQLPDFARDLRRLSRRLEGVRPRPWIAVLSSSRMQAEMAAEWLSLPKEKVRWFTHEFVDYYSPSVLVFPRGQLANDMDRGGNSDRTPDPRPYALSERGNLNAAPEFRAHSIGEHVKFMLPPEARAKLFTYEDFTYEEEPESQEDDEEPRHPKQASGG